MTQHYGAIQGLAALGPNVVFPLPVMIIGADNYGY